MGTSLKVVETPRRLHVKYLVGKNAYDCVSVFSEPIRSSDPYKQCLDWSVGMIGVLPSTKAGRSLVSLGAK